MDNYSKFKLLHLELEKAKDACIRQAKDNPLVKNLMVTFAQRAVKTKQTPRSPYAASDFFNEVFPYGRLIFDHCDSHLHKLYTGICLHTYGKLNLPENILPISANCFNTHDEFYTYTEYFHSHTSFKENTRSFTVHYPIWIDQDVQDESYVIESVFTKSLFDDYKNTGRRQTNSAYYSEIDNLDPKYKSSKKCNGFTVLDFNSTMLHRAIVPDNMILNSIVFDYPKRDDSDELMFGEEFLTNLSFNDCLKAISTLAPISINKYCASINY